jgi:hypothetical protein
MLLWLKTKLEVISILLAQSRIEDVSDCVAVTKLECMAIRDQLFIRRLEEIDFMLKVKNGKIEAALAKGAEIRDHAKKFFQNDQSYTEFLGCLSELMYNLDKREEACTIVKEGRLIAWYRLRDQGIEIDQQNINCTEILVNNSRRRPDEAQLAQYASSVPPSAAGTKAAAKNPKDKAPAKDKKGEAAPAEELATEQDDEPEPLDFTKEVKYDLVPAEGSINSSKVTPNIYLQSLGLAIRFDIRYSQYCIMIQEKYELAKKVLLDTQKLIRRTLYVSP